MNTGLTLLTATLAAGFLLLSIVPALARDFRILLISETGSNRPDDSIVAEFLINGGYGHGLAEGISGSIWDVSTDSTKNWCGHATLVNVDEKMSVCNAVSIPRDKPDQRWLVSFEPVELSESEMLVKGNEAFELGDYHRAMFYYDRLLRPPGVDEFLDNRIEECRDRLADSEHSWLPAEAMETEKDCAIIYLEIARSYWVYEEYESALDYVEKALTIAPWDVSANKLKELIEYCDRSPGIRIGYRENSLVDEWETGIDDYLDSLRVFASRLDERLQLVDKLPVLIRQATPSYPWTARNAGLEGTVWIKALVNEKGKTVAAKIYVSSHFPALDRAALSAADKNIWSPAQLDGEPMAIWVTYKVEFKLDPR